MSTDPGTAPQPEVLPSSTPDGPQVIPTHGTPEGEPGPAPTEDPTSAAQRKDLAAADTRADGGSVPFDIRESDPNAGGSAGLSGGMGLSSEGTGPADPHAPGHGITGMGSIGGSTDGTRGTFDTSNQQWDAPDVSQAGSTTQQIRDEDIGRTDRREEQQHLEVAPGTGDNLDQGPVRTFGEEGVDRTVGEPNTLPLGGVKEHGSRSGRDY